MFYAIEIYFMNIILSVDYDYTLYGIHSWVKQHIPQMVKILK